MQQTLPKLSEDQVALLNEVQIATVVTLMPDGSPHVTPVWVDTDGEAVIFNTAIDRVKYKNLLRDPRVTVSVVDKNDYYRICIVNGRAELILDGASAHIDKLAKKYMGVDSFPYKHGQTTRVIVRVVPEKIMKGWS
jgi:PPOX class probable F420-dependent enzyme